MMAANEEIGFLFSNEHPHLDRSTVLFNKTED